MLSVHFWHSILILASWPPVGTSRSQVHNLVAPSLVVCVALLLLMQFAVGGWQCLRARSTVDCATACGALRIGGDTSTFVTYTIYGRRFDKVSRVKCIWKVHLWFLYWGMSYVQLQQQHVLEKHSRTHMLLTFESVNYKHLQAVCTLEGGRGVGSTWVLTTSTQSVLSEYSWEYPSPSSLQYLYLIEGREAHLCVVGLGTLCWHKFEHTRPKRGKVKEKWGLGTRQSFLAYL